MVVNTTASAITRGASLCGTIASAHDGVYVASALRRNSDSRVMASESAA